MQEKYSKIKCNLEKKKNELEAVKANFSFERSNNQKLETLYKAILAEKASLQKQVWRILLAVQKY